MTSDDTFPQKLTLVDDLTHPDHHYLSTEDICCFLDEYTARGGYSFSATNRLISNFKKPADRRRYRDEWQYKERAIKESAAAFGCALKKAEWVEWLDAATLIPIPPSKAKTDPLYDDRLTRMLHTIRPQPPLDIRELILQKASTAAAHCSDTRPRPETLEALYEIDQDLITPLPHVIGLFDDVLTTGAHFKAAQSLLNKTFPGVNVIGFFIARRVPGTMDIE